MRGIRDIFHRVLNLRDDTPESIARGAVIGLILAMIPPPFGPQSLFALGVAWLLRSNRLAAVAMTFVTNPLTFYIYVINYMVGLPLLKFTVGWSAPSPRALWRTFGECQTFWDYTWQLAHVGLDIFVPMTVGGVVVAGALSAPLYVSVRRWVVERRARKAQEPEGMSA